MTNFFSWPLGRWLLTPLALLATAGMAQAQTTTNFAYTGGTQTYTVPTGIRQLDVVAQGGGSGNSQFGNTVAGALVKATVAVVPGEVLTIVVGGAGANQVGSSNIAAGGYNGGGSTGNHGGGAGGATDLRRTGTTTGDYLTSRNALLVAGGAGGTGYSTVGGAGGTPNGANGSGASAGINGGNGGTQSSPGSVSGSFGMAGTNGDGGNGSSTGGGGGGYYGGGSGYYTSGSSLDAGGGGGSSFVMATGSTTISYGSAGTVSNGVLSITTVVSTNNALAFDGTNDYVHSTGTLPNTGEFTLEGWVNPSALSNTFSAFVLSDGFPTGAMHCQFYGNNLGFTINGNNPTDVVSTSALPLGRWSHVAVVYSASAKTVKFYVNGALNTTGTYSTAISLAALPYSLGGWLSGSPQRLFYGKYDEVRMYSAALTQAQVQADMFSTTAAVPASLKAYYNFDQGTAGGTNTGQTTLADQSSTGNTGTLTNFALTGTASNFVRSFPTITGISPTTGNISTSVTLTGTNLTDATSFAFNGTSTTGFATPTSDLAATATVPTGATTGPVSVASATLTTYNGPTFTVSYPDLTVSTFMQLTPGIYNNVTITSTGGGYFASAGQLFQVMGKMVVQPGGFYSGNGTIVTGPGSFTLSRRTEMNVTTASGISTTGATGDVQVTGTRTFSKDATYNYSSYNSSAQVTGSGLPSRVLTFRNYNQAAVTFTNSLAIRNVLSYYNGTPPTRPAGITITLLSDNDSTASVEYAGTAYPGSYIVQRYVSGDLNPGAGYRHVSAPVAGPTVGDLATASFSPVVNPAYNTSATPGTTTPFPTVYGYDQTRLATTTNNLGAFDKGFFSPAATTTTLAAGQGYAVQLPAGQTFSFTGTVRSGGVPVALTRGTDANAGWALVGNPFAAGFDMASLNNTTGVDNAKYVVQSSGPYTGSYRSYVNGVGGNSIVALGQAFFARVSSGSTSATLTMNSSNTVTGDNTKFYRTTADPRPLVQLDLAGNSLADTFYAYAETGATAAFDSQYDAAKLPNSTGLNLSSVSPLGENLAIDGQGTFVASTVLPLAVGVPVAGTYTLSATALNNLPAGLDAYLRDSQTGQQLLLAAGTSYSFSVTAAQAAALLTGRFALVFRSQSTLATVAALAATDVTVYPNPAHASFTVALPGVAGASTVQAELLNTLGQVVRRQSAALPTAGTALTLATADLAPGVYVLRLQAGATTLAKRVVVQ